MAREFSNTNPEYKSLAEIRKEAYEQGRTDAIKEFVAWYDKEYESYQKYSGGYCKVKLYTVVRRFEKRNS